ncbi:UNVERIFIED_CONTAM: hypothetical protein Sangu_2584300 [Sesamum angustifolium]|uniref:Uncharacterized protein n=1 Tax=Sesamum angustifolium TaxID=2727405 RepID=A0AAW2J9B5_9LAMI
MASSPDALERVRSSNKGDQPTTIYVTSSHRSSGRKVRRSFGTLNMPRHAALPEKSCETRVTSEKVTKGTS